jgi:hypothetical protein
LTSHSVDAKIFDVASLICLGETKFVILNWETWMNDDAKKHADAILNHIMDDDPVIVSTRNQFNGTPVALQVNVPSDLRESLKLLSYKTGKSMAEIVSHLLTTQEVLHKIWISTENPNS